MVTLAPAGYVTVAPGQRREERAQREGKSLGILADNRGFCRADMSWKVADCGKFSSTVNASATPGEIIKSS